MQTLKENDYAAAASILNTSISAIKAVAEVESAGSGFLNDGRPKILFEAHIFSKLTNHIYDDTHPNISSKFWNRDLYVGGAEEYERLEEAKKINLECALKSASWGKFQIMGFNFNLCGFNNVFDFVEAMYQGEDKHLFAFCNFIKSNAKLYRALRTYNWKEFARYYNGKNYQKNNYDVKLSNAFKKYLNE